MVQIRDFKTSFNAGELSEAASARSDITPYKNGAAKITNWRQLIQGGLTRRMGSRRGSELDVTKTYRLHKYIFDKDQKYLLIFSDQKLEIIPDSGRFISTTLTGQPWTASMVSDLYVAAQGDTIIVMHEDLPPVKILRTGSITFTSSNYEFETDSTAPTPKKFCPFYKYAASNITMTPSATTGTGITLTLSSAYWQAGHAGLYVRYKGKQLKITSITSSTVAVADVIETLPSTTASSDWDEEAFSSIYGYPIAGSFNDQRFHFCGSKNLPRNTWSSNVSAYYKFDTGTGLDDESIQGAIAENNVGSIRAISTLKQFQIFCDSAEVLIPTTDSKPLTPSNLAYKVQTKYGTSTRFVADFGDSTLYITLGGQVREFVFDTLNTTFSSFSMSYLSDHLLRNPIRIESQLEGFGNQEQYAFVLNNDGTIAVLLAERTEKINSWSEWTTNGTYKDICAVGDDLYVICDRVVNGVTRRFIELFEIDSMLDFSSTDYSSTAKSVWTGFTEYANQEVYVVSGNYFIGKFTVDSSGTLDLGTIEVNDIEIGYNYTPYLKTLPPELQLQDGPTFGEPRRVISAVVYFGDTLNAIIEGNKLIIRDVVSDLSKSPTPVKGRKEFFFRGWDREGQLEIQQDVPLPITIYSLNIKLEF